MTLGVRRIVTGDDESGRGIVVTDETLNAVSRGMGPAISGCEICSTNSQSRKKRARVLLASASVKLSTGMLLCAAALVVSMSISYAGPCSQEIARFRTEIDAKQRANAAAGPSAPESTAATAHRQPTQRSIGDALSRLGEVSPDKVQAVLAALERANEADRSGDQTACGEALADARRAFGQ
jgi:hypothetical protein